jgi:hypothetical protein
MPWIWIPDDSPAIPECEAARRREAARRAGMITQEEVCVRLGRTPQWLSDKFHPGKLEFARMAGDHSAQYVSTESVKRFAPTVGIEFKDHVETADFKDAKP